MKKLFNYTMAALAISAMAACSEDITPENVVTTPEVIDPNAGKEVIAFSPEGSGMTRAEGDPVGFANNTKVVMRVKAQNGTATGRTDYRYTQAVLKAGVKVSDCCTAWGMNYEHNHLTYIADNIRYWDDAFGRESKLTIYAVAVPDQSDPTNLADDILDQTLGNITAVNPTTNPKWYTVNEGKTEDTKISWTVSKVQDATTMPQEDLAYSNNIRSDVPTSDVKEKGRYKQTWGGTPADWQKTMDFGRLEWEAQTGSSTVGKFDQGHLLFKHALTYLEIQLNEGAGYKPESATDFDWTNPNSGSTQSIKLKYFPIAGELDLSKAINADGMWTPTTPTVGTDDIIQLKQVRAADGTKITLEGYVIPGTTLSGNTNNLIEFEIDNTKYYVTGNQIATAITSHDGSKTAEAAKTLAGKKYVINLTVGKTAISQITAAILPWEDVNTTTTEANNTHFSFEFEDRGTKLDGSGSNADMFDIYCAERTAGDFIDNVTTDGTPATTSTYDYEWKTGYGTAATKTYVTDHWTTNWHWKNNKTWYHFRAAGTGESKTTSPTITVNGTNGDYFAINHGAIDGSGSYKDWVWGAPFVDVAANYKFWYDTTDGFATKKGSSDYQIAPAIASTHDVINMLLFHMTSQITVNLSTTDGDDKVVLYVPEDNTDPEHPIAAKKTEVKIVRFIPSGKVRMGTGLVVPDEVTRTSQVMKDGTPQTTVNETSKTYDGFTWGMVPQQLNYTTDAIGLEITTPDGNTYYVRDLSTITAQITDDPESLKETHLANPYTQVGSTGKYTINEWFPHYKYVYNITLKKKGILDITAAILPWEIVNGDNINIDLEN